MQTHHPGTLVPHAGDYEELDASGSPTGRVVQCDPEETLPDAPEGFSWRSVSSEGR
jgi:hypothetical protein